MATNIKKAGSVIRRSFRSRRYAMLDAKENNYIDSPAKAPKANTMSRGSSFRHRQSSSSGDDESVCYQPSGPNGASQTGLRRSSVTQSMRDAVGTIRQKLRVSTRRRTNLQTTPTRAGKRRHTMGGKNIKMSSPFKIDTPSRTGRTQIKTCFSMETPTRLRREVESLTANMQALSALTPNTLHTRAQARKTPPLTNGSLKTPRSSRRRITTEIN